MISDQVSMSTLTKLHLFVFTDCLGSFRGGLFIAARQSSNAYTDLRSCVNGNHRYNQFKNKTNQNLQVKHTHENIMLKN